MTTNVMAIMALCIIISLVSIGQPANPAATQSVSSQWVGERIPQSGRGCRTKDAELPPTLVGGVSVPSQILCFVTLQTKSPNASPPGRATAPSTQTFRQPIGYAFFSPQTSLSTPPVSLTSPSLPMPPLLFWSDKGASTHSHLRNGPVFPAVPFNPLKIHLRMSSSALSTSSGTAF